MEIASLLMTHRDIDLTKDTLESIKTHVSNDVLIVVDGKWWTKFWKIDFGVTCVKGFNHGHSCSPYRNQMAGLQRLLELKPNADWYLYVENDVLFGNDKFKKDLKLADRMKAWAAGFDYKEHHYHEWKALSKISGILVDKNVYMIGCCQFYKGDFLRLLKEKDFFNKIINYSEKYAPLFPGYNGLAVEEGMLPCVCASMGKKIYSIGCWDSDYRRKEYGVRYRPEWTPPEMVHDFSIIHPIKTVESIRKRYKKIRDFKNKN